ncbi:MAG: hypothetical protein DI535_25630 [Citrobacter freundii]|nr:MAG: hypothetical protein DI535_25630 [Citrobacter freundii]
MNQQTIVIILSALLLLFLLWKEIRRSNRSNFWLRIIATVITVLMLPLFFIPISFEKKIREGTYPKILLITSQTEHTTDSFAGYKQITTDPALQSQQVEFIPDLSTYISRHLPEISFIHILGKGIEEHEWNLLDELDIQTSYTPAPVPLGIIHADWPRTVRLGDQLGIQGIYNNHGGKEVKLVLSGLGTSLDSVIIKKDSVQNFYLSCQPSHTAQTLYELQTVRDEKTVGTEKIPVTINASAKPAVLFLSSSPGFENKFLTQWLHAHNYPTAVRNTISRDKYDQQFLNMKATALNNISSSLLENFDLLIADDYALSELNANATASIRAQLEKGMGLIIQSDTINSLSNFSRSFALKKQMAQKTAMRSLAWNGSAARSPLAAEQWFSIQNDASAQPLVTDDQQSVIASCRLYGSGKVVMNTATSTFGWLLSGNDENYASFWSLLISRAARTRKPAASWYTDPAFPSMDHQVKLLLETDIEQPPVIKTASGELYTAQTPYLPDTWTASWWPANPGWQTLSCTDTTSIYVFEESDWSAAKQYAAINKNNALAARQRSILKKTSTLQTERRTVPVYIFFIVFVAGCGLLWWEAKRW